MKKPKILFLRTDWAENETRQKDDLYGGIGYYRSVKPAEALKKYYQVDMLGTGIVNMGTPEEVWTKIFSDYDLVWTRYSDNPKPVSDMLAAAKFFYKPVVVDIDDNYLEILPSQPGYKWYHPGSQKRSILGALLSLADGVSVSTKPLAEAYGSHIKEVHGVDQTFFQLPNCNDINDWPKVKRKPGKRITIGYAGSVTHDEDLMTVLPVIADIMKQDSRVDLEFLGAVRTEKVKELLADFSKSALGRVIIRAGTPAWKGYPELLASMNWDIGIAPLADNSFNKCKSHIKWMEYSMIGIPTVASNVYPYAEDIGDTKTIQHWETGLLPEGRDEWKKSLEALISMPSERKRLADNAYDYIASHWQWKHHIHKWVDSIDAILGTTKN